MADTPATRSYAVSLAKTDTDDLEASRQRSIVIDLHADEPVWPTEWRAYTCLLGCFFLMFNSWGIVNAYGTYASFYLQHLFPGRDILLFNLIGSTQCFFILGLSLFSGRFLDAGYSRHLLVIGTVLTFLGQFLISVANGDGGYNKGNYGLTWLTQGLISALGMACFFVASSQIAATWFIKRKSTAVGIVASGASISGLVYPMMLKYLIASHGFNNAVRFVAILIAATCVTAVLTARPNPKHEIRPLDGWMKMSHFIDKEARHNAPFMWFCAAISWLFFGFYAVFFNLEEWAASKGFGYKDASPIDIGLPREVPAEAIRVFWLLCIMNASSSIGRVGGAYLSDRFGSLNVHAVVTYIASLLILVVWTTASSVKATIAFVITFGIFSGAVIGLPPASVAYILGPHQQAKLGQYTGMMYSCSAIFALTGPVIAGHLISHYGNNYLTVQLWSGFSLFLSAVCMTFAIYYRRRQQAAEQAAAAVMTRSMTGQSSDQTLCDGAGSSYRSRNVSSAMTEKDGEKDGASIMG